jgi:hypothetical protein
VSEELENSLQQAIETYLNDRLRSIDEQVSRLQTEVNEALAQLRESSNAQSLDGTTLSAAIFAHLQTARGQKLTGAAVSAPAPRDAGAIKRAVSDIETQQTQTEILKSLLKGAVHFAERVALFVIKNDQAIGWRVCEATDPTNLELIGGVSIPLGAETILTRAVRARSTWSGDPRSSSEDRMLIDQLGGAPQMVFSIPLTVRGKVVAVLYADSASSDSEASNLDALEILVRVAAMAVNLASGHRAAPEPRPEITAVRTEPATDRAAEVESTYAPQVEAQVAEPEAQPAPVETAEISAQAEEVTPEEIPATEAVAEEPPAQLAAEPAAAVEPSAPHTPPEPETIPKPADSVWS